MQSRTVVKHDGKEKVDEVIIPVQDHTDPPPHNRHTPMSVVATVVVVDAWEHN